MRKILSLVLIILIATNGFTVPGPTQFCASDPATNDDPPTARLGVSGGGDLTNPHAILSEAQALVQLQEWLLNPNAATKQPRPYLPDRDTLVPTQPAGLAGGSAPTISDFGPSRSVIGSLVSIFGSGLRSATAVRFNGVDALFFSALNNFNITAVVAPGTTTGRITVVTPQGTATSASDFTVSGPPPAPVISAINPSAGTVDGPVIITGSNLTLTTEINFNGVRAQTWQYAVDGSSLLTVVPLGATSGPITVRATGGSATSDPFTVTPMGTQVTGTVTDLASGRLIAGLEVTLATAQGTQRVRTTLRGRYGFDVSAATDAKLIFSNPQYQSQEVAFTYVDTPLVFDRRLAAIANPISILNPPDGTITSESRIDVMGALANPRGATVTINGTRATLDLTTFTARGIPLTPGMNTVQAVLQPGGVTTQVSVLALAAPALELGQVQAGDDGTGARSISFLVPANMAPPFQISVYNGNPSSGADRVAALAVALNGDIVIAPEEFDRTVASLQRQIGPITDLDPGTLLRTQNQLDVVAFGLMGDYVTLFLTGSSMSPQDIARTSLLEFVTITNLGNFGIPADPDAAGQLIEQVVQAIGDAVDPLAIFRSASARLSAAGVDATISDAAGLALAADIKGPIDLSDGSPLEALSVKAAVRLMRYLEIDTTPPRRATEARDGIARLAATARGAANAGAITPAQIRSREDLSRVLANDGSGLGDALRPYRYYDDNDNPVAPLRLGEACGFLQRNRATITALASSLRSRFLRTYASDLPSSASTTRQECRIAQLIGAPVFDELYRRTGIRDFRDNLLVTYSNMCPSDKTGTTCLMALLLANGGQIPPFRRPNDFGAAGLSPNTAIYANARGIDDGLSPVPGIPVVRTGDPSPSQRLDAALTLINNESAQVELIARTLLYQVNTTTAQQSAIVPSINYALGNYFGITDRALRQAAGRVAQYGTASLSGQRYFNLESRFVISDCLDLPAFGNIAGPYRAGLAAISPFSGQVIAAVAVTFQLQQSGINLTASDVQHLDTAGRIARRGTITGKLRCDIVRWRRQVPASENCRPDPTRPEFCLYLDPYRETFLADVSLGQPYRINGFVRCVLGCLTPAFMQTYAAQ